MKKILENPPIGPKDVNERQERTKRLILSAQTELANVKKMVAQLESTDSTIPKYLFDQELVTMNSMINLLTHRIAVLRQEYDFIRAPSESDLQYRKTVLNTFAPEIKRMGIRKREMRFHGTSLVYALQMIESGELSSSQDRGLGRTSHDIGGRISVTDYQSVQVSIRDYTGIKDHLLPMGCIFVVTPENRADARSIRSYSMKSLKIFENGGPSPRLRHILTSPESLPIIRKQLKKFGYPENLAIDYLKFLEK